MAKARLLYYTPTGLMKFKNFEDVPSARKYAKRVNKRKGYYVSSIRTCNKKTGKVHFVRI